MKKHFCRFKHLFTVAGAFFVAGLVFYLSRGCFTKSTERDAAIWFPNKETTLQTENSRPPILNFDESPKKLQQVSEPSIAGQSPEKVLTDHPPDRLPDFRKMPVAERQAFLAARRKLYEGFNQKEPEELLRQLQSEWDSPETGKDSTHTRLTLNALGASLQRDNRRSSDKTYKEIAEMLHGDRLTKEQKLGLLKVLGIAQTSESLELLLSMIEAYVEREVRNDAIYQIAQIDAVRFQENFKEHLYPQLKKAWIDYRELGDVELDRALSLAMARTGHPEGVSFLVAEVIQGSLNVQELKENATSRSQAAMESLTKVRNPKAIDTLAEILQQSPPGSAMEYVSDTALAHAGKPDATHALLMWSLTREEEFSAIAQSWFLEVKDSASRKFLYSALADPERYKFTSSEMRTMIVETLAFTE